MKFHHLWSSRKNPLLLEKKSPPPGKNPPDAHDCSAVNHAVTKAASVFLAVEIRRLVPTWTGDILVHFFTSSFLYAFSSWRSWQHQRHLRTAGKTRKRHRNAGPALVRTYSWRVGRSLAALSTLDCLCGTSLAPSTLAFFKYNCDACQRQTNRMKRAALFRDARRMRSRAIKFTLLRHTQSFSD